MSLGDHLEELRQRLVKGLLAVIVVFAAAWGFKERIFHLATEPMRQSVVWLNEEKARLAEARLVEEPELDRSEYFDEQGALRDPVPEEALSTGAGAAFFFFLKSTAYFSLFLGGPVLLYQMWMFIAAGLYRTERRLVLSYLPASVLLFFAGVLFSYFVMVPYAMFFLNKDGLMILDFQMKIDEYFSFLSTLCLGLGLVFQLPIVMNAVVRAGMVERKELAGYRGHFALFAFVLAAILTPPDPFTQLMMAVPMIVLFEVGLLTSVVGRRVERAVAAEA
jgi:sec-independent protein translocase protein TatC